MTCRRLAQINAVFPCLAIAEALSYAAAARGDEKRLKWVIAAAGPLPHLGAIAERASAARFLLAPSSSDERIYADVHPDIARAACWRRIVKNASLPRADPQNSMTFVLSIDIPPDVEDAIDVIERMHDKSFFLPNSQDRTLLSCAHWCNAKWATRVLYKYCCGTARVYDSLLWTFYLSSPPTPPPSFTLFVSLFAYFCQ